MMAEKDALVCIYITEWTQQYGYH